MYFLLPSSYPLMSSSQCRCGRITTCVGLQRPHEKVPILGGGARGALINECCKREVALVTPERGEL
jgi:hypothetical protein